MTTLVETSPEGKFLSALRENIGQVLVGKEEAVQMLLIALICGGHVLIEDLPGLGKTTLAAALARSLGVSFARIQCTPDTLPSDITGFTAYDLASGKKEVRFGAVMSQLVLADELNRTSPKTQASLLEAMQERQVTIDGTTYPLPEPFMVVATQNPSELTGTYPLPEAQLDRFLLKIPMGYPSGEEEQRILQRRREGAALQRLQPVGSAQDVLGLRSRWEQVRCAPELLRYIVQIARATREDECIALGVSPRGSAALMDAAAARALICGRDYAIPDDVKAMAGPVLGHRLRLSLQAGMKGHTAGEVLQRLLQRLPVPGTGRDLA